MFGRKRPSAATTGYSVIDDELTISGDIDTKGSIRIDGRVEGKLHRANTLIVGASGVIVGDVEAREVVAGGEIRGNLVVSDRVEVQATATITGDIRAAAILLLEGGKVHGHMSTHPVGANVQSPPHERRLTLTPKLGAQAIAKS
jgi:cytoskeletal protein CcmA (bactofilin family)